MEAMRLDARPAELLPLKGILSSQHYVDDGSIATLPDKQASCGGHGTLEILKVTQVLEAHGIPCCLVGTSALIYYGANRARGVS